MEYIINETKLFNVILKWLRKEYPKLRVEQVGPNIIFWDKKNIILLYKKKPMELFVSSDNDIRLVLMDFFRLTERQTHKLLKLWLQKDYKLFVKNVVIRKKKIE